MDNHSHGALQTEEHGSYKSYLLGFVLSSILTLAAYFLVVDHLLAGIPLIAALIALALIQAVVQLILFLHLGSEGKPHWNVMTFLFMALILVVIVFGSLWIMYNLNYQMMPSMEMDMRQQSGL